MVWHPAPSWRLRANAEEALSADRTLSELYQPVGQDAMVVEANPSLRTERDYDTEVGIDYSFNQFKNEGELNGGLDAPAGFTIGAAAFSHEIQDAIGGANLIVASPVPLVPFFGPLPPGTVARQRINVDRETVRGIKFSAEWRPLKELSLNGTLALNESDIGKASADPALAGKEVALMPRHTATGNVVWRAPGQVTLWSGVRWLGRQFEDEENTLGLKQATVVNVGATRPLTKYVE